MRAFVPYGLSAGNRGSLTGRGSGRIFRNLTGRGSGGSFEISENADLNSHD